MNAGLLVAVLVPLALLGGIALGWAAHKRFSRSTSEIEGKFLLQCAQVDVTRLSRETTALREQLSVVRAEKAGLEPQVARLPELESRLQKAQQELLQANEARGSLQARVDQIPALEQAVKGERDQVSRLQEDGAKTREESARLKAQLEEATQRIEEQRQLLRDLEVKFREAFRSLSAEALKSNNQAFLDLAKAAMNEFQQGAKADLEGRQSALAQVVAPVRETLEKFDAAVRGIERDRVDAYTGLQEQVAALKESQRQLQSETSSLVKALRSPTSRGRWGEVQLRRVVELAGMVENCDFTDQAHVIVHLPGNKSTVIDAKVPLAAYLDSLEAQDEETRRTHLRDHARQVKNHMTQLGNKAYWDELPSSPDFVVMYVPMESAFAAALQEDPGLIDYAVECRVIPCGPMTLLTHLKAAASGWRQEQIVANAERVRELGKELYDRLGTLAAHFADVGKHLGKATGAFNEAVGSLEGRVLISARRFRDLGAATGEELPEVEPVAVLPRAMQAPEREAATEDPVRRLRAVERDTEVKSQPA